MPDHNAHGVGFKRMRMAGLLPAAALILAVFPPSTVSAAEVKLAGAVVSGLFYSKAESAERIRIWFSRESVRLRTIRASRFLEERI